MSTSLYVQVVYESVGRYSSEYTDIRLYVVFTTTIGICARINLACYLVSSLLIRSRVMGSIILELKLKKQKSVLLFFNA